MADKNTVAGPALNLFCSILIAFLVSACGGGSGGNSGSDNPGTDPGINPGGNDSVVEVLESFGVDTRSTPRIDDGGEALPEDYSPLGTNTTIARFEEAVLFGVPIDTDAGLAGTTGGLNPVIDFDLNGTSLSAELLSDSNTDSHPWFGSGVVRAAIAADVDADGLDEQVVVWQTEADAAVQLAVIQDVATVPSQGAPSVVATGVSLQNINIVSGDLDGNGNVDVAIALIDNSGAIEIVVFLNESGVLSSSTHNVVIPGGSPNGYIHVALSSGNLDRDDANELAVVVNRYGGGIDTSTGSTITTGTSNWYLFDDTKRNLSQLATGQSIVTTAEGPTVLKVADMALGDIDADGVDEVILGGLDQIGRQGDSGTTRPSYYIEVFDDARTGFESIASNRVASELPRSGGGSSQYMYYLFVRTADLDGDGAEEIITNQYVWDDFRSSAGSLTPLVDQVASAQNGITTNVQIPTEALFSIDQRSYYFSPVHVSFDVGDLNGDERDDVAFWVQRLNFQIRPQGLFVYGLSMDRGFSDYVSVETAFSNPQSPYRASLLIGDYEINGDTAALRLDAGSYRYDLTAPVVLAVLAAAPCAENLGQDLTSCRTGIGSSSTTGNNETEGYSVFVNGVAGWDARDPITSSGGAILAKVGFEVRNYETTAYRTIISVLRETGPIEDTVVFTTIPYDVWSYKVLSHPDPELIGRTIEVRLPRTPIEIMTTLDIYNSNTLDDALKIDASILKHTPGDPGSYPTSAEANALLNQFKGIKSDVQTVGLNSGRQTVTIDQFTETTDGQEYRWTGSIETATVLGGVVLSAEIGGSTGKDVATVKGEGTTYLGQVAEIGPDNPISASYKFGLFTYIYEPGNGHAPFEVINYWVEDF